MFFQPYVHVRVGSPTLLQMRIVVVKGDDECDDNGKEPGAVRRASDVSRGPGEVPDDIRELGVRGGRVIWDGGRGISVRTQGGEGDGDDEGR